MVKHRQNGRIDGRMMGRGTGRNQIRIGELSTLGERLGDMRHLVGVHSRRQALTSRPPLEANGTYRHGAQQNREKADHGPRENARTDGG